MARKDAMMNLRQILIRRRDALRKALAGDLSLLKELRQQNSGDVIDAALDSAQDEISSQLAEVESRELTHIETALERMRQGRLWPLRRLRPGDSAGPAAGPALRHDVHPVPARSREERRAARRAI